MAEYSRRIDEFGNCRYPTEYLASDQPLTRSYQHSGLKFHLGLIQVFFSYDNLLYALSLAFFPPFPIVQEYRKVRIILLFL